MDRVGFEPTTSATVFGTAFFTSHLKEQKIRKENDIVQIYTAPFLFYCMLGSPVSARILNKKGYPR
jgi:hypothetical protein